MRRIMVVGPSGAGKSTFCEKLSEKTGLSLFHVDQIFFHSNWVERDVEDFLSDHRKIIEQERWILDGNAVSHLPPRAERAELLIYLHPPRLTNLARLFWRRFRFAGRSDRPAGCPERLSWKLIRYTWNYDRKYRTRILSLPTPIVEFRSLRNAYRWLSESTNLTQISRF